MPSTWWTNSSPYSAIAASSPAYRLPIVTEVCRFEREHIRELQQRMNAVAARFEQVERNLRDERERVNAAERELREAQFSQRECRSKLGEIRNNRELALKQIDDLLQLAQHHDRTACQPCTNHYRETAIRGAAKARQALQESQ